MFHNYFKTTWWKKWFTVSALKVGSALRIYNVKELLNLECAVISINDLKVVQNVNINKIQPTTFQKWGFITEIWRLAQNRPIAVYWRRSLEIRERMLNSCSVVSKAKLVIQIYCFSWIYIDALLLFQIEKHLIALFFWTTAFTNQSVYTHINIKNLGQYWAVSWLNIVRNEANIMNSTITWSINRLTSQVSGEPRPV